MLENERGKKNYVNDSCHSLSDFITFFFTQIFISLFLFLIQCQARKEKIDKR